MSTETEVLTFVCQCLDQAEIPYMLTGSFAANFYAVPRMTRDIDLVIELNSGDVDKLFEIFHNDFYIDKESIIDAIEHEGIFNIIHNNSVLKIDFIIRKNAAYRNTEFQRRRQIDLGNTPIWIVTPEDLIISKLFWAKDSQSEMQIKDVKNLLSSLQDIDKQYIEKWIQELHLKPIYETVSAYA